MSKAATNKTINEEEEEEEDDDYLGDLSQFLPPETSQPPKSSSKRVPNNKTLIPEPSNKKPRTLNWQEQRKIKREQKQHEEDQQTLKNIESAIPQSNIGFKLLRQMGYTPGSVLGREGSGPTEPVGLEIRRSRAGIGREDPRTERLRIEKEKVMREKESFERDRRRDEELMKEFGFRKKEQWRSKRILVNFHKAKLALEQLENKEVVEVEKNEEGDEEIDDEEEEEEVITEEDLQDILMRLRDEYHYCLFCGCRYESMEALLSDCPGRDEDDH